SQRLVDFSSLLLNKIVAQTMALVCTTNLSMFLLLESYYAMKLRCHRLALRQNEGLISVPTKRFPGDVGATVVFLCESVAAGILSKQYHVLSKQFYILSKQFHVLSPNF
ncbi:hypothetical protein ACQKOF_24915, partial [Lysinibacillus sp. NPDC093190]|uniref:hypothetical protein n=1 Tax=Lysinibacillus sp. NPDC093190 TaxID=3390575 RepID=UPI003D0741FC